MIEAVPFIPADHYEMLCQWAEKRHMAKPPLFLLPSTGRIVPGVAAAFLYKTDSRVGFIENLISNPDANPGVSSEAIDLCVLAIAEEARRLGFEFLWGSTFIPGVVERAKRLGFVARPERLTLITLRL